MGSSAALQQQIESTLRTTVPEVEVLLAEQPSPGLVRVTIDRPGGVVDLDLCERVSRELSPLRERYALEVSSPGIERPLVKPDHYRLPRAAACTSAPPMRLTGAGRSRAR